MVEEASVLVPAQAEEASARVPAAAVGVIDLQTVPIPTVPRVLGAELSAIQAQTSHLTGVLPLIGLLVNLAIIVHRRIGKGRPAAARAHRATFKII